MHSSNVINYVYCTRCETSLVRLRAGYSYSFIQLIPSRAHFPDERVAPHTHRRELVGLGCLSRCANECTLYCTAQTPLPWFHASRQYWRSVPSASARCHGAVHVLLRGAAVSVRRATFQSGSLQRPPSTSSSETAANYIVAPLFMIARLDRE